MDQPDQNSRIDADLGVDDEVEEVPMVNAGEQTKFESTNVTTNKGKAPMYNDEGVEDSDVSRKHVPKTIVEEKREEVEDTDRIQTKDMTSDIELTEELRQQGYVKKFSVCGVREYFYALNVPPESKIVKNIEGEIRVLKVSKEGFVQVMGKDGKFFLMTRTLPKADSSQLKRTSHPSMQYVREAPLYSAPSPTNSVETNAFEIETRKQSDLDAALTDADFILQTLGTVLIKSIDPKVLTAMIENNECSIQLPSKPGETKEALIKRYLEVFTRNIKCINSYVLTRNANQAMEMTTNPQNKQFSPSNVAQGVGRPHGTLVPASDPLASRMAQPAQTPNSKSGEGGCIIS